MDCTPSVVTYGVFKLLIYIIWSFEPSYTWLNDD